VTGSYQTLIERMKDIGRLSGVSQLLDWDQETYMPRGGVAARAEQSALLAGLIHERLVADETRRLLDDVTVHDDDFVAVTNVREARRVYERASRIPTELVKEIAHTSSLAKDAWGEARSRDEFARFSPWLIKLVALKRRVADLIGYETEPYDALMDEFEPGAKAAVLETIFAELREKTVALLQRIQASPRPPDDTILSQTFPEERQRVLSSRMAEAVGFDLARGRADVSAHPFCTTIGGPLDVRITTRYQERFLPSALFGTLHECGHALYEQGLPEGRRGEPIGEAVSLGIHESQSRLWENLVGRSRAFWKFHYSSLLELFPDTLYNVSLDDFYRAINKVKPSLIRVEADEVTYNLHIILRFELERALFRDRLSVEDLPSAWNEGMTQTVGVTPKRDADGCLQDIHWSMGAFGYFPTYTLGNLYAAQFFERAREDVPDLFDAIADNDHRPLLQWLRENIHQHGRRFRAGELVLRVTGRPLSCDSFVRYVTGKCADVYRW